MAIYAANCPCCGRDIGFDEGVKEYTCIFCGAKLITATLAKELIDHDRKAGYEHYRRNDAEDERHSSGSGREHSSDSYHEHHHEHHHSEHSTHEHSEEKSAEKEPKNEEPELTEEEIRVQLMRKAEFKQELRDVVKEIDSLRARRGHFTSQLKVCKTLMIIGLVFVGLAAGVMLIPAGIIEENARFIAAGALAAIGVAILIFSETKKNGVKKQQKKLEENISDKKENRDILIGRLNKINKRLHIHSDGE